MTHKMPLEDFRAVRTVLDATDFALSSEGPDSLPADLIDERAWHGIMDLPDDVAIRTTNDRGKMIRLLCDLHGGWIEKIPDNIPLGCSMLDAAEAFDASTFNLIHGYYKQATSALRDALELMALAAFCELSGDQKNWDTWLSGGNVKFSEFCNGLQNHAAVRPIEEIARAETGNSLFGGTDGHGRGAWIRDCYKRLSSYSHARSGSLNSEMWESNGPIYAAKGFDIACQAWLETHAIGVILVCIAENDYAFSPHAIGALSAKSIATYLTSPFDRVCLSYLTQLGEGLRRSTKEIRV